MAYSEADKAAFFQDVAPLLEEIGRHVGKFSEGMEAARAAQPPQRGTWLKKALGAPAPQAQRTEAVQAYEQAGNVMKHVRHNSDILQEESVLELDRRLESFKRKLEECMDTIRAQPRRTGEAAQALVHANDALRAAERFEYAAGRNRFYTESRENSVGRREANRAALPVSDSFENRGPGLSHCMALYIPAKKPDKPNKGPVR
jgi:hypothetical protein